jgi:FkbM family methyltransferase
MNNIALNKPAKQSSTSQWSIGHSNEADARQANNGDKSGKMWCHTGEEANPWWQVDLQESYLIQGAVLFNRPDQAGRLKRFRLLTSLDGETWRCVYQKKDDSIFGKSVTDSFAINFKPTLARFVRISLDGHGFLHFSELEVFGEKPDPAQLQQYIQIETKEVRAEIEAQRMRETLPDGRNGSIIDVDGFAVLIDHDNYDKRIINALKQGSYELKERSLAKQLLQPTDRVLELGTAIGVMAMTIARIVGPENLLTFDANPDIVADAQENFRRNELSRIKSRCGLLVNRASALSKEREIDFFVDKAFWASRLAASADTTGIVKIVKIPICCLEEQIMHHNANVIICDIEGGEVDLLTKADLSGIRLIILETHYWAAGEADTDYMIRKLVLDGFSIDLGRSGSHVYALRR